jgi:hypothetical protein
MMEDIAADDWHEQLLVTITGVKTVFEQTKDGNTDSSSFPRPHQVRI